MAIRETAGRQVVVRFNGGRCIHARRCVMGAPAAFEANAPGEWIHPDAAAPEDLLRIAYACPSGAITVERLDGGIGEVPPPANQVLLRENGPLAVHAALTVAGHGAMTRATLCRCGLSARKPFCDNSHIKGGFVASGEPVARESTLGISELTGPVVVEPLPNGPLKITGSLEVTSGTGRSVARVERAMFCRCGQSANKPFCDGSHKRVGFESE